MSGPVAESERYAVLDLLRGFALFGVLIVNLLYFFRISLFAHIAGFPDQGGWANQAVAVVVDRFIEIKAFEIFSLTFGIGVAIQAGRQGRAETFLLRRFLVLLAIGLCHIVLIANVDILTLYAVCGLLMIPLLRLPAVVLAAIGIAAAFLPIMVPGPPFPSEAMLRADALQAARVYGHGSWSEMLVFRWQETVTMILPLLIGVLQRTFGLMLIGAALWRSGVVRDTRRYRPWLIAVCVVCAVWGFAARFDVPIAFAYTSAVLAFGNAASFRPVAAAGRMALTNYLTQELLFAALFYGFGLFGKLDLVTAAALGVAVYGAQLAFSVWWLRRYRFGPFEWFWRSLTYGRRQPMRVTALPLL